MSKILFALSGLRSIDVSPLIAVLGPMMLNFRAITDVVPPFGGG